MKRNDYNVRELEAVALQIGTNYTIDINNGTRAPIFTYNDGIQIDDNSSVSSLKIGELRKNSGTEKKNKLLYKHKDIKSVQKIITKRLVVTPTKRLHVALVASICYLLSSVILYIN